MKNPSFRRAALAILPSFLLLCCLKKLNTIEAFSLPVSVSSIGITTIEGRRIGIISRHDGTCDTQSGYPSLPVSRRYSSSQQAMSKSSEESTALIASLLYRHPTPDDIERCYQIESASYPEDEAATKEGLTHRQQNASDYFLLCYRPGASKDDSSNDDDDDEDQIIGFVCGTRCQDFTEESMSAHNPDGALLAIHSVVVEGIYRRQGVATVMLTQYIKEMKQQQQLQAHGDGTISPITRLVLLAKNHLLGFYVRCGFSVLRPSPIVHGQELWYDLELKLVRSTPNPGERWFMVTGHLKSAPGNTSKQSAAMHRKWANVQRLKGECLISGFHPENDSDADSESADGSKMLLLAASDAEAATRIMDAEVSGLKCGMEWQLKEWTEDSGHLSVG